MYYIVGLGNPGEKYASTRHNVGWQVLQKFIADRQLPELIESRSLSGMVSLGKISQEEITILLPTTFMNNSGSAVTKLVPPDEVERLIVVHDDIDLPLGEIKIGKGRGPGGNNGVQSIITAVHTKEFIRVRIGIATKSFWTGKITRPEGGGPLERFVLKPFTSTEQKQLSSVIKNAGSAIDAIVTKGVVIAMNEFNYR
ncbi:aminoacyl-tRNA hydrolase [Candidatus Parcubacteria bacterium]|nr:aminoacyl-tRNA hydrolase [Candidatus Parcubacteria bacterium]